MLPSVKIQELDSSVVSESFTGEIGGYVGVFEKGSINEPMFIKSATQFKTIFGRGIDIFAPYWFQVYNYLQYSSGIFVQRVVGKDTYNSASNDSNNRKFTISNRDEFYDNYHNVKVERGVTFIAESSGEAGNLVQVYIVNEEDYNNNIDVFGTNCKSLFSYFNSGYVGVVIARDSVIKEINYVSLDSIDLSDSDYKSAPFTSQYLYAKFNKFNVHHKGLYTLFGGITQIPTEEDYKEAYSNFENKETYVIDNFIGNQDYPNMAIDLAELRRDMLVFLGLPVSKVESILGFENDEGGVDIWSTEEGDILIFDPNELNNKYDICDVKEFLSTLKPSSFLVVTNNIKVQFNPYRNNRILLNVAGDIAGLKSQTSLTSLYSAGAGLTNGQIKNIEKCYLRWSHNELLEMYDLNCNYIQKNIMQSQRTFIDKGSDFSSVNVRALFNHIEREIEYINAESVFEFADAHTLDKIKSHCIKILDEAKSSRGLDDYYIEVESKLNSNEIVNPHKIVVSVYIKPTYVAEYIVLRMYNNGQIDTK